MQYITCVQPKYRRFTYVNQPANIQGDRADQVIQKSHLMLLVNNFGSQRTTHERTVADIDKEIERLLAQKAEAQSAAFAADVRQKAMRAAIRMLEDNGLG